MSISLALPRPAGKNMAEDNGSASRRRIPAGRGALSAAQRNGANEFVAQGSRLHSVGLQARPLRYNSARLYT